MNVRWDSIDINAHIPAHLTESPTNKKLRGRVEPCWLRRRSAGSVLPQVAGSSGCFQHRQCLRGLFRQGWPVMLARRWSGQRRRRLDRCDG